jgi:hypothetical protein
MIAERFAWQVICCNEAQECVARLSKTIHKFSNIATLNFNVAAFYTLI